ncbi:polysaccharide biosynthesis/export family protein [Thalassoglobus polymorphus]|nr:polysaccharide biosynthesis/export family protein [Thalassoglobus polymorphus]
MNNSANIVGRPLRTGKWLRPLQLVLIGMVLTCSTGCSILHPVRGVPASYLPDEFEGPRRNGKRTINPSLLVQTPPAQHRVAAGDVLSIYIPGVLGRKDTEVRQVGVEPPINQPYTPDDAPTIGYPITVRDDNTISLPQIPPINVNQMTLAEVEEAVRRTYTEDFDILKPEEAMILVSLQRPRVHRVLVVRQETGNELASGGEAGTINIGVSKRGTARIVTLNAYENDVLHALATVEGVDGLPGLDAENTIYIIRRRNQNFGTGNPATNPHCPPSQYTPSLPPQQQVPSQYQGGLGNHSKNQNQRSVQLASATNHAPQSRLMTADYRIGGNESNAAPYNIHSVGGHSTGVRTVGHSFANVGGAQHSPYSYQHGAKPNGAQASQATQPQMNRSAGGYPVPHNMSQAAHPYGRQLPHATPQTNVSQSQTSPAQAAFPNPEHQQVQPAGATRIPLPVPANSNVLEPIPDDSLHWSTALQQFDPTIDNPNVIRIPIRLADGEMPNISEEMITLEDGDIVFIESRETDVFYTGGLLGGGQYTLPREYDLGVLEAISIAEGRNSGGGGNSRSIGGVSALNRDVSIGASRVIILRTLPTGQRITVEVDLHKAMRYQEENILVQPGDILMLQYTAGEAIAAFTQRYLLEGALFSLAAAQMNTNN